jgi:hypothetical protein
LHKSEKAAPLHSTEQNNESGSREREMPQSGREADSRFFYLAMGLHKEVEGW